jgi:hypothetical protein
MTINFDAAGEVIPHGTFDSFFDVFFDIRLGSPDGPIALSDTLPLTANGTPWNHDPPPGAVLIDGVNHNLNHLDRSNDFFPIGAIQHDGPGAARNVVDVTRHVPDAGSTLLVLALGLVSLGILRRGIRA